MVERADDERTVIVGVDGSPGSAVALRWAIDHADRLGRVVPVTTFVTGPFEYGFGATSGTGGTGEPYRSEAELMLSKFLQAHAPELVGTGLVVEERAGPALVEAADRSELLVLGTRGWGTRQDLSIGSVGSYCARHARVPVALIPHDVPIGRERLSVVVGVDGSPHAAHALRWALQHLRLTAEVIALRVAQDGAVPGDPLSTTDEAAEAASYRRLEDDVAGVLADLDGHPAVDVLVVRGDPRQMLGTAVPDADLLVVGARGHGLVHRLLLGSVSTAVTHHPTLPTIVVPSGKADDGPS